MFPLKSQKAEEGVCANGRLFNTAASCFARSLARLLQTAAVAVLAVQRFGGECLRRRALPTAFCPSMIADTNSSNLLQSFVVYRLHVWRAGLAHEFACSIFYLELASNAHVLFAALCYFGLPPKLRQIL